LNIFDRALIFPTALTSLIVINSLTHQANV